MTSISPLSSRSVFDALGALDLHLAVTDADVTKRCMSHCLTVMQEKIRLTESEESSQFEEFLAEVLEASKGSKTKGSEEVDCTGLVSELDVHRFLSATISPWSVANKICEVLEEWPKRKGFDRKKEAEKKIDEEQIQRICWDCYFKEKKAVVTKGEWLSYESTYRLFLIYNKLLLRDDTTDLEVGQVNAFLMKLVSMSQYAWNPNSEYKAAGSDFVNFPEFVTVVTECFETLNLTTDFTNGLILELYDLMIKRIHKKGFLEKKGHVRKNWTRRYFVLKKTTLRYYEDSAQTKLKGEVIMNKNTKLLDVKDADTHIHPNKFKVICGVSGKVYEISAEDKKTKQSWILAIQKAQSLAIVKSPSNREEFVTSLAQWRQLVYGDNPSFFTLSRSQSAVLPQQHATDRGARSLVEYRNRLPRDYELPLNSRLSLESMPEFAEVQALTKMKSTSDRMPSSTQWRHSIACDNLSTLAGSRPQPETVLPQQQVNDEVVRNLVENKNSLSGDCPSLSQNSHSSLENIHDHIYAEIGLFQSSPPSSSFSAKNTPEILDVSNTYVTVGSHKTLKQAHDSMYENFPGARDSSEVKAPWPVGTASSSPPSTRGGDIGDEVDDDVQQQVSNGDMEMGTDSHLSKLDDSNTYVTVGSHTTSKQVHDNVYEVLPGTRDSSGDEAPVDTNSPPSARGGDIGDDVDDDVQGQVSNGEMEMGTNSQLELPVCPDSSQEIEIVNCDQKVMMGRSQNEIDVLGRSQNEIDVLGALELYLWITDADVTKRCMMQCLKVLQDDARPTESGERGRFEEFLRDIIKLLEVVRGPKVKGPRKVDRTLLASDANLEGFHSGFRSPWFMASKICDVLKEWPWNMGSKKEKDSRKKINEDRVRRVCWEYYFKEKEGVIAKKEWLSPECTYRLFLLYNRLLEDDTTDLGFGQLNAFLMKIVTISQYAWNPHFEYKAEGSDSVDFPAFFAVVTECFESLHLTTDFIGELIFEVYDLMIDGIHKKGFLEKKGHVRKNWTRRYFVLKTITLRYYDDSAQNNLKGELVMNENTKLEDVRDADSPNHPNKFIVTCGVSRKELEICAEDKRTKQSWFLAIQKAWSLSKIKSPSSREEFATSLVQWRQLVYGDSSRTLTASRHQLGVVSLRRKVTDEVLRNLAENRNTFTGDCNISLRNWSLGSKSDHAETQSPTKTSPSAQWRHSVACENPSSFPGNRPPSKTVLLQQQVGDEVVRNLVENRSCFSRNYNTSSQSSQLSLESIPEPREVVGPQSESLSEENKKSRPPLMRQTALSPSDSLPTSFSTQEKAQVSEIGTYITMNTPKPEVEVDSGSDEELSSTEDGSDCIMGDKALVVNGNSTPPPSREHGADRDRTSETDFKT